MPRYEDYGSAYAVVNHDGTTTYGDIQYHWDGSYFVKILHSWPIDLRDTEFRIEQIAHSANTGDISIFSVQPSGARGMLLMYVAWLRVAIERGQTTLERAQEVFANFVALGAEAWGLDPSLPERIEEEQELAFFGLDFTGTLIPALDVLTKPNPYVDTSAVDSPSRSWVVPDGYSREQAVGEAWSGHVVREVSDVAKALAEEAAGVEHGVRATAYDLRSTPYQEWIQKLYLAFFLRPADPGGFDYYALKLEDAATSVQQVASSFGASPEYVQTYAGLATVQRIDAIYKNLFGRAAEAAGLKYWGERLDDGTFSIGNIAFSILVGAQNADLTTINNRVAVSHLFTASLDTTLQVQAYSGLEAAAVARDFLSAVTSDQASASAAANQINAAAKFLGASGTVTRQPQGDSIALSNTRPNIIIYDSLVGGRTDVITGFQFGDRLDLSALHVGTAVHRRQVDIAATTIEGLFAAAAVVVDQRAATSHIYVDINRDGHFAVSADAVIHIAGVPVPLDALTM